MASNWTSSSLTMINWRCYVPLADLREAHASFFRDWMDS